MDIITKVFLKMLIGSVWRPETSLEIKIHFESGTFLVSDIALHYGQNLKINK